jgi:hypothetical protein
VKSKDQGRFCSNLNKTRLEDRLEDFDTLNIQEILRLIKKSLEEKMTCREISEDNMDEDQEIGTLWTMIRRTLLKVKKKKDFLLKDYPLMQMILQINDSLKHFGMIKMIKD